MAETRKADKSPAKTAGQKGIAYSAPSLIGPDEAVTAGLKVKRSNLAGKGAGRRAARRSGKPLVWPSGQGREIATLNLGLDKILKAITKASKAGSDEFPEALIVTEVEEDGAEAFLLDGLAIGPIVLMTEPGAPVGVVSVVADQAEDIALATRRLRSIFGAALAVA